MDDRQVAAAIVAGDPAGLADAYDEYAALLYGYCSWMLPESGDAAGALQHTFVIAATKLGGIQDPPKLRPWLYAVARHECHRRLRTAGLSSAADVAGQPAAGSRDAGRAELAGLIRDTIDGLNPGDREVIELTLGHDLSDSDLAVVLGTSGSRAQALAARALGQLEEALSMLLIARTGRKACPALDELLAGWDGRPTSQTHGLVSWHVMQCQTCAGRKRGALRLQALSGLLPQPALPPGLREQVLGLGAGIPRDPLTHRQRTARRAQPPRYLWFLRAARLAGQGKIRDNPGPVTAAAAVVVWAAAAVSATLITLTGSHPAPALTARTSGALPAAASTPANIRGAAPATVPPAQPKKQAKPSPSRIPSATRSPSPSLPPAPSPAPSPSPLPSA